MRTKLAILLATVFSATTAFSQQQIVDVTEQTIKVGAMKTEEMLFGFAEGDQIIFNFTETDKKDLKEVEIIEYPSNSKFSDYKVDRIENKILNVSKTAIYKFRFYNSAISGRVCKIKIQRIPGTEATKHYNTSVTWVNKQDTVWNSYTKDVIVGYDSTYEQKSKLELVKTEYTEELLLNKTQRIGAGVNKDQSYVQFSLPANEFNAYKTRKVTAWAYWIAVGDEANKAWQQNSKAISGLVQGVAKTTISPLGAFALGKVTELIIPKVGENVHYSLTDRNNATLFMYGKAYNVFDKGNGTGGYRKYLDKRMSQGTYYICLYNDNILQPINTTVKVVAIIETQYYQDTPYTELKVTPRYEKQIFKDPTIKTAQVPVAG